MVGGSGVQGSETEAVTADRRRRGSSSSVLAAAMLGLADVLEPTPPRDMGAEVVDAPADEPEPRLTFGRLAPIEETD